MVFNIRSAFAKATAGQVWDIPATFKGASLTHIGENVIGIMEIVQLVAVLDNNSHSFQQIRIVWFCFHLLSLLYGEVNLKMFGLSSADTIPGQDVMNDTEAMCQQGIVKELPVAVQKGGVVLKQVRFFIPAFAGAKGHVFP